MADPLSQLRQFHINGQKIEERNGFIIFGDYGWPKEVNTNYQVYTTDDDKSKKEYYTLECLLYFLRNMDVTHAHYVKQAGQDNKPVVRRPDRNGLLTYLKGESQTAPGIDKNAPIPSCRLSVVDINRRSQQQAARDSGPGASSYSSGSQAHGDENRSSDLPTPVKRHHEEDISKERAAFVARLNEPSNKKLATIVSTEGIRDGSESSAAINKKFGAEKLAELRAKALAVKRTTINDADTEQSISQADPSGREDLLFALDAEKYKLIKSKEKVWRTRTSILQSQSKNFAKTVLGMLDLLSRSDDPNKKSISSMPTVATDLPINPYHQTNPHQQQQHQSQQAAANRNNSYSRYDQERFVKLNIGVEIDTNVSYVDGMVANVLPGQAQPQPTQNATQPRLPTNPSQMAMVKNGRPPSSRPREGPPTELRKPHGVSKKTPSRVPIIIIPATTTSIINMYNAAAILQDLTYVDGQATGKPRESETAILRKKPDGSSAIYKIVDNPTKFDRDDWNRVVAVFVQGPAWQFKGWPWDGSPVEIFSHIKGFHLKWDESKLDENVAKWNVHILELSRSRRHLDKANLLKFWSSLDAFMAKYKSFLKF